MYASQTIQEEHHSKPHSVFPAALSREEHQRFKQQRNPARKQIIEMRKLFEPIGNKRKGNSRNPGNGKRTREGASQTKRAIATEGEAQERCHAMNGERA